VGKAAAGVGPCASIIFVATMRPRTTSPPTSLPHHFMMQSSPSPGPLLPLSAGLSLFSRCSSDHAEGPCFSASPPCSAAA
jgi:hypothetical protein